MNPKDYTLGTEYLDKYKNIRWHYKPIPFDLKWRQAIMGRIDQFTKKSPLENHQFSQFLQDVVVLHCNPSYVQIYWMHFAGIPFSNEMTFVG